AGDDRPLPRDPREASFPQSVHSAPSGRRPHRLGGTSPRLTAFVWALSRELELAAGSQHDPVRIHAAVAARQARKASSRKTRSVQRDVRWRWTLKVFWTLA